MLSPHCLRKEHNIKKIKVVSGLHYLLQMMEPFQKFPFWTFLVSVRASHFSLSQAKILAAMTAWAGPSVDSICKTCSNTASDFIVWGTKFSSGFFSLEALHKLYKRFWKQVAKETIISLMMNTGVISFPLLLWRSTLVLCCVLCGKLTLRSLGFFFFFLLFFLIRQILQTNVFDHCSNHWNP